MHQSLVLASYAPSVCLRRARPRFPDGHAGLHFIEWNPPDGRGLVDVRNAVGQVRAAGQEHHVLLADGADRRLEGEQQLHRPGLPASLLPYLPRGTSPRPRQGRGSRRAVPHPPVKDEPVAAHHQHLLPVIQHHHCGGGRDAQDVLFESYAVRQLNVSDRQHGAAGVVDHPLPMDGPLAGLLAHAAEPNGRLVRGTVARHLPNDRGTWRDAGTPLLNGQPRTRADSGWR